MKSNIEHWNVEDAIFWKETGNKIATRNLWISIPALLLAFSIWIMWSIIIVGMEKLGFTFGMLSQEFEAIIRNTSISRADYPGELTEQLKSINSLYYTLPAIAGLAGATLRIPNSFLIAIGGGRNVIFTSTSLLLIPAIGVGLALQDPSTPFMTFAILAALSGFGGGNFASSMSNISYFFPKKVQGTSLGLNAGLGNLGVSVMQFLLPFGMNNLKSATPKIGSAIVGIGKTLFLISLGLVATAVGVYMLVALKINMWIVLPVVVLITVLLMKYLSPGEIKSNLKHQFSIFNNKHNWIMTIIYTMTFGSFIGFSAAFPKLISDVFGSLPDGSINPNAPSPYAWAFLGPMVKPVKPQLQRCTGGPFSVCLWSCL